jgi:hypothetical protein
MTSWKGCFPVGFLIGALGFMPMEARAEVSASDMQLVQKLCVASFNNAFAQAGKEAPEGMGAFTCDCLGKRIKAGDGLGTARETCTMEASRRYPQAQS